MTPLISTSMSRTVLRSAQYSLHWAGFLFREPASFRGTSSPWLLSHVTLL